MGQDSLLFGINTRESYSIWAFNLQDQWPKIKLHFKKNN